MNVVQAVWPYLLWNRTMCVTAEGQNPFMLCLVDENTTGRGNPFLSCLCGKRHDGNGGPLSSRPVAKKTRRERISPLSSRLWWQQITTALKNELCACFRGWWSGGGGSSIYHPWKQASELVFEGSGRWGTCLMVSNTKRKRNIAGVPCTPTPRVPFLLAFLLFAFEVAVCQWLWSARLLIIPCTNNTQRFVNDKQ